MEVKNLLHLYDIFKGHNESPLTEAQLHHLQDWGLIAKAGHYKCRNDHILKIFQSTQHNDGWAWRCYKKVVKPHQKSKICRANISIRKGTLFEHSQLSIFQILAFCYLWIENTESSFIKKNVEISSGTASNLNKCCREICTFAAVQNNINIDDELQLNEFRLNPRKMYFRKAYEKFVFLKWCKLNNKSPFMEFLKYAGLLHNPLDPSTYEEFLSLQAQKEEDKESTLKENESDTVEDLTI